MLNRCIDRNCRTALCAIFLLSFLCLMLPSLLPLAGVSLQLIYQAAHAQAEPAKHVKPTLIADTTAVVPGKSFKLGVHLQMDPGWHTYYKESGEAGMPTRITWKLPEGFKASDLLWEKPNRFNDAGITTFGYHDQTLIGAEITAPSNLPVGKTLTFSAEVKWLACQDMCIPGEATVTLKLPVAKSAQPAHASEFHKLGFNAPTSTIGGNGGDSGGSDKGAGNGGNAGDNSGASSSGNTAGNAGGNAGAANGGNVSQSSAIQPAKFSGDILTADLKVQGSDQNLGLLTCLGLALVGGFILNFMPCVLPVISIKVLSFMQQAGEDPKRVFRLGLTFTAGIISSFMLLAGLVVGIKAAGQKIGWGFQFQFPVFLLAMSAIVLVFALSLFGLIYFQFNAGQNEIDKLASKEGFTGTFFKGVLATTLSTPCSAPFLGTALGFAFSQPAWTVLLIFFCIGVGMASPYVVLTARPEWMKFLPKSGVWMEKFKQSMGFLLIATDVWLVWVLGQQVGLNAAMAAVGFLVAIAFAVWMVGSFIDLTSSGKRKAIVYSLALLTLIGSYIAFLQPFPQLLSTSPAVAQQSSLPPTTTAMVAGVVPALATTLPKEGKEAIDWQPFSIETLDNQLKAGKTVFIDFTADWCLTCKVNETTVLNTAAVIDKLKSLNVVTLRADWTRQDPTISRLLQKFGRSGVPLYVVFPAKNPTAPIVLPEVISQELVVQKLDEAGGSLN